LRSATALAAITGMNGSHTEVHDGGWATTVSRTDMSRPTAAATAISSSPASDPTSTMSTPAWRIRRVLEVRLSPVLSNSGVVPAPIGRIR
jgi:hypothetical protein